MDYAKESLRLHEEEWNGKIEVVVIVGYRISHFVEEIASIAQLVRFTPNEFDIVLCVLYRVHFFWEDGIGRTNHVQQNTESVRALYVSSLQPLGIMCRKEL